MKKLIALLLTAGALALGAVSPSPVLAQAAAADAKKDAKAAPAADAKAAPAADAKKEEAKPDAKAEAKPEEKKDEAKPAPTPNKGDVAWMLTATALVLLM